MAQRSVYRVLKLSSIFYFVVCHHSRQRLSRRWHKQLFALLLTLRGTHGLRFWTMQRTL
ncbi:hypothetical protein Gotri_005913 [Gossypium trilobum]|uniref:Uncharacterized protein n=1 Tax=Gossypium trilobum TaxID=34281 RepID=A0A7J9EYI9_9ROSI|nr:hypothetical protein [Gossypium trilobum]MBA0777971.1 hypothetical protein [Gossypium trilobum]